MLPSLAELLDLETIDRDMYRSVALYDDPLPLYGGQVAAQALAAAGRTVPQDRLPHSLHCYYLRRGTADAPVFFHVYRDHDGRSYTARRVVGIQNGEVIFTMSVSFTRFEFDVDHEPEPLPDVPGPADLPEWHCARLQSIHTRTTQPEAQWPTRFWARSAVELPESPLIHACVLTYLSDISSGLVDMPNGESSIGASLDHAVWFHRIPRLDEWMLVDLTPRTVSAGRGFYSGTVRGSDGTTVATLTQEMTFRTTKMAVL
ncbi:acyl-CoA thioesterase [Nocardia sp. NPDC059246]|uniref:acyl-CoA thioesterase n=1 Tax=unclassified Nocardia TaxID=2637762 RepID=UPI0036B14990